MGPVGVHRNGLINGSGSYGCRILTLLPRKTRVGGRVGGGGNVGGVFIPKSGDQRQVDTSLPSDDEESVGTFGATKGTEVIGGTADEAESSTSSSEEDAAQCKGVDMVL